MSTRFDFLYLGDVDLVGPPSFFGEAYFYYVTEEEWFMKEFSGVLTTVHGDKFRGRWTQGPEFEELERLFMSNRVLKAAAVGAIHRRLNMYEENSDG